MSQQQPYPWKLRKEDLPSSFQAAINQPEPLKLPLLQIAWGLVCIMLACLWLICQSFLLESGYVITWQEQKLPEPPQTKITVAPSPVRYSLLAKSDNPGPDENATGMNLSHAQAEPRMLPINFSSEALPKDNPGPTPLQQLSLTPPPPAVPEVPEFQLIGIAQGRDGTVATIKVAGEADEVKDVREEENLSGGYKVTRIASEYVLLKKDGKTIRVD